MRASFSSQQAQIFAVDLLFPGELFNGEDHGDDWDEVGHTGGWRTSLRGIP